jgi:hypothetical protein
MLSDLLEDRIDNDTLSLHSAPLPPIGPANIHVPTDTLPPSIRGGQTLTVSQGGIVDWNYRVGRGSRVTITGGEVGGYLEAFGATINVSGGIVGSDLAAFEQSAVNISGGSVGPFLQIDGGTIMNISGGSVGIGLQARRGSQINISGGTVGGFSANSDAKVNITGGAIGSFNVGDTSSKLKISGGDFRLDGVPIAGLETVGSTKGVNLKQHITESPVGSVLSGTLADGTPFLITTQAGDIVRNGALTLEAAAVPPVGPTNIQVPGNPAPQGLRQGQTLTVSEGGSIGGPAGFIAGPGSTLNVSGGTVSQLKASGAKVNISGGAVFLDAFSGSEVNISGTDANAFGARVEAYNESHVAISGGTFSKILAHTGSVVDIAGGAILRTTDYRTFEAEAGSEINVTGGDFQGRFGAFGRPTERLAVNIRGGNFREFQTSHADINLFGTDFRLNGVEIPGLVLDQPFTITERSVTLSGLFADGSPFSFDLNTPVTTADYFGSGSHVTVTRVAPITMAGDYDHNGTVDVADYLVWRKTLGQSGTSMAADGNRNGAVDTGDYNLWRANFGRTFATSAAAGHASASIPEPSSLALALAAVAWIGFGLLRTR